MYIYFIYLNIACYIFQIAYYIINVFCTIIWISYLLPHFFRWENWSPAGLDNLSKVLQVISGKQNTSLPATQNGAFSSISVLWVGLILNQGVARGC